MYIKYLPFKYLILVSFLLFADVAKGQSSLWQWARTGECTRDSYAASVTTDLSGNVFVTGYFSGPFIQLGTYTLSNISSPHGQLFVAKYDVNGNVLWAVTPYVSNAGFSQGISIVSDKAGGAYVTGNFTNNIIAFGDDTLTGGFNNIFMARYSASGDAIWARKLTGSGSSADAPTALTADAGNVYMVGNYSGSRLISGTDTLYSIGMKDVLICKFDINGNVRWLKSAGNSGTLNDGTGIVYSADGAIYVAGTYDNSFLAFGNDTLRNYGIDVSKVFLYKLDLAGNLIWSRQGGDLSFPEKIMLATDAPGNVYMGSSIIGFATLDTTFIFSADTIKATNFVIKYDSAGGILWANNIRGTADLVAAAMVTDASGNLYMSGRFNNGSLMFGADTITSWGYPDIVLLKFDNSGGEVWNKTIHGPLRGSGDCLAADIGGNIYMGGNFSSEGIRFNNDSITNTGTSSMYVAKLTAGTSNVPVIVDKKATVAVYPNPVTGNGILSVAVKPGSYDHMIVYNAVGVAMAERSISNTDTELSMPVQNWAAGVYYLRVYGSNKSGWVAFVVR